MIPTATIGIGVTTRNRRSVAYTTIGKIREFLPPGARLVVVDDCSSPPYPKSDYRFPYNAGVATAKNKCIELLEGCEHVFLFDDDCYPATPDWYVPYINSGINHLSFTFSKLASGKPNGNRKIRTKGKFTQYANPCGCMLYFRRICFERVGGFDPGYTKYSFEHVDLSRRIHNAGLTPHPYMDVAGSVRLFYSYDYHSKVPSTGDRRFRELNRVRFEARKSSRDFIPYKRMPMKNVIFAAFFNYAPDPQGESRRDGLRFDQPEALRPLIDSCARLKQHLIIFHDSLDCPDEEYVRFERVAPSNKFSPNNYRWIVYNDYFRSGFECEAVFMVDSTDVELLQPPFPHIKDGVLYCGSEKNMKVENPWMKGQRRHTNIPDYKPVIYPFRNDRLLNCGVVGGSAGIVREYLGTLAITHNKYANGVMHSLDMTVFNYVVHKYFKGRFEIGDHINTVFKAYDYDNKTAWFRHK